MNKKDLNLSIARLYRVFNKVDTLEEMESLKKAFVVLYREDRGFEQLNHKNLLRMLVMNLALKAIDPSRFGAHIETNEL